MNAITTTPANGSPGLGLMPRTMDEALRLAEMMARGKLMPAHLQGSPGDCLMVVELSMRLGMSPFAVAQCTSVIQGKLMLEGKLVAAALHGSGVLASRLSYDYTGEGAGRAVTVSAVLAGEAEPRTMLIRLADVKTPNQLWTKQPDQQLAYSAARNWARRFAPEVMLGIYTPEEMNEAPMPAAAVRLDHAPATALIGREAINAEVPLRQDTPLVEPAKMTGAQWLAAFESELDAATTSDAVEAILARDTTRKMGGFFRNGARDRFNAAAGAALARFAVYPEDDGGGKPEAGNIPDPAADERATRFSPPPAKVAWPQNDEHLPETQPDRFGKQARTELGEIISDEIPF